jgi:hypothetical protein
MSRSNFITLIVKASSINQIIYKERDSDSDYESENKERDSDSDYDSENTERDGRLSKLYQSIVRLEELIESARKSDKNHET